jgi:hypothetical protein
MGEAKKRRAIEVQKYPRSKSMNRARFAILTMGTRMSRTAYMSDEISWWASLDERVLGMVAFDKTDRDYFWMILLRDRIGRFRCANLRVDFKSVQRAESELRIAMFDLIDAGDIEKHGQQGDETNNPINLFLEAVDQDPEKLHPYYKIVRDDPGHQPARLVLSELALWLAPAGPHLVREFQTAGFDQRIWELYLWAAFKEFSLDVELLEAPDFWCRGPGIDFTVEATTIGPSKEGALANHPNPTTRPEISEFLDNYMPLKFGSALMSKLNKKNKDGLHYWDLDKAKGKPFAIAVADFHASLNPDNPGTMTFTQSALWQYLYGHRVNWEFEGDKLIIKSNKIDIHAYRDKEAPSGFFDLELAKDVSAIIFSNAGTVAKFNRMGVAAGWHPEAHNYIRSGFRYNPDPDAVTGTHFVEQVKEDGYSEWWTQEVQVFHNPNAKRPFPFEWLLGATHHYFEDGNLKSFAPHDAVLSSVTMILRVTDQNTFM